MFHALGDASRRAMVERLARGPASVSELASPFDMALPSVVQHLGVLEAAGIVSSTKVGRVRTYQLVPDALTPAGEWIRRQRLPAERRLDRLGAFLEPGRSEPANSEPGESEARNSEPGESETSKSETSESEPAKSEGDKS
ncbi:ArsR/SmtB family transcription factor [Hamadaea tsunoensis]|uniref:ArsR/SmtB family transcription factor n=1 Tax=Hamadaea tsunoensis TaxID=53368 RepID=UPI00040B1EA4|nr:metalloregulator ArsR/SmtB family transcription factor [Hamadaea tsunoensis]